MLTHTHTHTHIYAHIGPLSWVFHFVWAWIRKSFSDRQAPAYFWASATSQSRVRVCFCVFWGTSLHRGAAFVNHQSGGWEQAEAVEMFILCWLRFVPVAWVFIGLAAAEALLSPPLPSQPLSSSPCFSASLEKERSEIMRGWTKEWGVDLGNYDLSVCAPVQNTLSFFYIFSSHCPPSHGAPPAHSLVETHPPFWWPWGSGSDLGFGTEMKRLEPANASAFPKQAARPSGEQEQHLICQKQHAFTSLLCFVSAYDSSTFHLYGT